MADPRCAYCGATEDTDHLEDCPVETNLWPVTPEDLGPTERLVCYDCHAPFVLGDCYTLIPSGEENVYGLAGALTIVCPGCAILRSRPAV